MRVFNIFAITRAERPFFMHFLTVIQQHIYIPYTRYEYIFLRLFFAGVD